MNEGAEMAIPHLFRCPISLDLFNDPVTLCTGQTYERSSIQEWLASGNLTCPVTMLQLHDPTMVPNHTLRHLIHQWLQIGGQFDPRQHLTTNPSLDALKNSLGSQDATFESKLQALEAIRVLSEEESSSASCLIQLGFLPLLLKLVFGRVFEAQLSEEDTKLVERALSCVVKLLPLSGMECLSILKEDESKLESFFYLFKHGNSLIKMNLCRLIAITASSSSSSKTKELCSVLGKTRPLLHEMAIFVGQGLEASDAGIEALWALSCLETNREYLIREGTVDGLLSYVSSGERSLAPLAMAILEKLLAFDSAKEALMSHPNGISGLVKKVFKVSDHEGSENAVRSLIMVCCGSLKAREEAIGAGVLTQLLLLLQSQCSGRTKAKARMLLKLLRSTRIETHV